MYIEGVEDRIERCTSSREWKEQNRQEEHILKRGRTRYISTVNLWNTCGVGAALSPAGFVLWVEFARAFYKWDIHN